MRRETAQVGIIGAGPAGLVLAHALHRAGISCVLVERGTREDVEQRSRAGLLEHRTVDHLRRAGLADGLLAKASQHHWCEFRCLGRSVRVDYAALSGGRRHWIYPQQALVRDLMDQLPDELMHFGSPVSEIAGTDSTRPVIRTEDMEITCDYVAACDGSLGAGRSHLLAAGATLLERPYEYRWLAVLAEVDRPVDGIVYAVNANGFAGMMPRTSRMARYYLQCPLTDTLEDWPPTRTAKELSRRLGPETEPLPTADAITDTQLLDMRAQLIDPPTLGHLFLAGDAAHTLTPSGAKGMNLAIADAVDLAESLKESLDGAKDRLNTYAHRRTKEAWQTQEFSDRLLRLLHLTPEESTHPTFPLNLRLTTITTLAEPGPHARAFAQEYAGSVTTERLSTITSW